MLEPRFGVERGLVEVDAGDNGPSWTANGDRIVFFSFRDSAFLNSDDAREGRRGSEIYIMGQNGRHVTRLTDNDAFDGWPSWAPRKRGLEVSENSVIIPNASSLEATPVQDLVARVAGAVVRIETDLGSGSGFIIDADGLVLTANHLVSDTTEINVYLTDGSMHVAAVQGRDLVRDLAVLKIEAGSLPWLTLGDVSRVALGSDVLAAGYPLNSTELTITSGLISNSERSSLTKHS